MYCQNKIMHTVQSGDSLYRLSRQYQTTVAELILGNPGVNPYNIQIGMELVVCPGEGYQSSEMNRLGQNTGNRGSMGNQGTMGMPGSTGNSENMGAPGNTGMPGSMGMPGSTGTQGNMGMPGSTGTSENMGMPGSTGTPGNMGMPGSTGSTGTPGNMEMPGNAGNQGNMGTPGNMGIPDNQENRGNQKEIENENAALQEAMQMAWLDHVFWTRMYLMSADMDAKDRQAVEERLLETADEITDVFANHLPLNVTRQLRNLLVEHIEIAGQMIAALKAGNMTDYDNLTRNWYANANQLATLLASQNPYFSNRDTRNMLLNHLDLTRQEIEQQLRGDYQESIDTFRDIKNQAIAMADFFARGLMAR